MQRHEFSREALGTQLRLILVCEEGAGEAAEAAFEEAARIEASYSRFIEGNDLADLNAQVGEWTPVSEELFGLLEFGEEIRVKSGGAFDLSVKSILDGWGYDAEYSLAEGEAGRTGSVELRGMEGEREAKLSAPIELGGFGKGYAVDRMVSVLEEVGLKNFLVDAGGDIFARGHDEADRPWKVALEHPLDPERALGMVDVDSFALASSSSNRRAWRDRHHLVDPRSGQPAGEMLATYVQAENAMLADAWATALFVMGDGEHLDQLPVEALVANSEGNLLCSAGFHAKFF